MTQVGNLKIAITPEIVEGYRPSHYELRGIRLAPYVVTPHSSPQP